MNRRKKTCVARPTESKAHVLSLLRSVSKSCQEGYDGTWDCSTSEGKQGFLAMQECVDRAIEWLRRSK